MAFWSKKDNSGAELRVRVQTPEGVVWEGSAEAVSSKNAAGPFDILPEHANIITLIEGHPIEVVIAGGSKNFSFEKALISVENDQVSIYADIVPGKKEDTQ